MAQSNRLTKAERREQARKEAERLRKIQEAKEKRSRRILIVVVILVVALIAAAAIVIYRQANKTVLSDFEGRSEARRVGKESASSWGQNNRKKAQSDS